jgi:hypothetical protein
VSQNLALVLSLQGTYEEAKLVGARQLSAEQAAANADYVKRMVQLEPKPLRATAAKAVGPEAPLAAAGQPATEQHPGWITRVAQVPSRAPELAPRLRADRRHAARRVRSSAGSLRTKQWPTWPCSGPVP